ncbi:transmembrane protein, putative [Medicago truncatula]|uniref:Transmembrane protein, putative n=1 Tax=Medicago truncatula TaxID=3880 RepID=G7KML8_MEDTR|nr:transmembrane protein, putative [Medicago truncatula]
MIDTVPRICYELATISLYLITDFLVVVVSVIRSYFSFVNLLYIENNNVLGDVMLVLRKMYRKFDKKYLKRIPR